MAGDWTLGRALNVALSLVSVASQMVKVALPSLLVRALPRRFVPLRRVTASPVVIGVMWAVTASLAPAIAVGFAFTVSVGAAALLLAGAMHRARMMLVTMMRLKVCVRAVCGFGVRCLGGVLSSLILRR